MPATLAETHGLTHMSDALIQLVLELETKRLSLHNTAGLHTYGSDILQHTLHEIIHDFLKLVVSQTAPLSSGRIVLRVEIVTIVVQCAIEFSHNLHFFPNLFGLIYFNNV